MVSGWSQLLREAEWVPKPSVLDSKYSAFLIKYNNAAVVNNYYAFTTCQALG